MESESHVRIQSIWKGIMPYRESLFLQEDLKKKLQCTVSNTSSKSTLNENFPRAFFIGFECPSCITLGLRGREETDLNSAIEEYKKQKIEIVAIKRGGQATLHSPGQLVIYPVMKLLQWKIRPRDFLSILEKITQDTLKKYGIVAEKQEDAAGLFTEKGKIAFFGIHISSGISQHGLALNVQNDLALFNLIRSCGVSHRPHDSFKNQGVQTDLKEVFSLWCKIAEDVFCTYYSRKTT